MIAGGVVFDLVTPAPYTGDPLLAGACVLSGATQATRTAVFTCVTALTAIVALAMRYSRFDHDHAVSIGNVVLAMVIAAFVNQVFQRTGRRLATVRYVAEAAQRALLPDPPARLGPLVIAARYEAAQSEARIGGDVYAAQRTPYGVRLLIGDVRGKGLNAVNAVAVLLGAFREAANEEPDLLGLAGRLDRALDREGVRRQGEEYLEGFTTGLLAEFAPEGGTLRLLNRGHPPPYLLDGRSVRTLAPDHPDLPFGMTAFGGVRTAPDTLPFPPGAVLLLVTDGVTETRDADGVFYDPQARLPGLGPFDSPQQAIEALLRDLETWTGGAHTTDDRAVLAVRLSPQDPQDSR